MISERGDQRRGPTANPHTIIEQVRIATSSETPYFSSIKPRPPVTMDEPKAMQTTRIDATRVMYHRYSRDQFLGFSGSAKVKVTKSEAPNPFLYLPSSPRTRCSVFVVWWRERLQIGCALWSLRGQDQSRFRECTLRETKVRLHDQRPGSYSPRGAHFPTPPKCKATLAFPYGEDCLEFWCPPEALLMLPETCFV
jgi:hypothetical protein